MEKKPASKHNRKGSVAEFEISPFIKSITTGIKIPADLDYKKEYYGYLVGKHK